MPLLETRLFTLHPSVREEFHRISRDETIPLMRRHGITVLMFGPCLNDENGYFLLRTFRSEQERGALAQEFYADPEWEAKYDGPITEMIAGYQTAVVPASQDVVHCLAALADAPPVSAG